MIHPEVKDYCCLDCFLDSVLRCYDKLNKHQGVSIIANSEISEILIKELLMFDEDRKFNISLIDINNEDYDLEYVITLSSNNTLWCEPAWRSNQYGTGYIGVESEYIFIHEDIPSSILKSAHSDNIIVFGIDD